MRQEAARALGELGADDELTIAALREAQGDTQLEVRWYAARSLSKLSAK